MTDSVPQAASIPTLAIVGRPNVGKSTLFNRIVGSRRAIVGDESGITRDRLYGEAEWRGQRIRDVANWCSMCYEKTVITGEESASEIKVAIIGHPNVGKSTLLNRLTGSERAIVSPVPGTTRDAVDEVVERDGQRFRFIDTAGIRRKGKTHLMAEKLSVVMARKHLEAADIALLVIDATEGVSQLDAAIAGYAHESGR